MLSVIGTTVAGLGLFLFGLRFLTENLKMLAGQRVRERIAAWTTRPLYGLFWGGVLAIITKSAKATMFILIGMRRAGMVSVGQSLPILIGANMTVGTIVVILALDIKVAFLFLLGIAAIVYTSDKAHALRSGAGAIFGIGLLFLGLNTMQVGVAPIADADWFEPVLEWTKTSYLLGFVAGAILSFILQSSLAVVVITIAFLHSGLVSLNESIMIVYGANVGSSLVSLALSARMSGQSKQIAAFQTSINFLGGAILVPLFYLEVFGGVPLVRSATEAIAQTAGAQIAIVFLVFNIVPGIVLLLFLGPTRTLLERIWPETPVEKASSPRYLYGYMAEDPDTALELIALEQSRLLGHLANSLGTLRQSKGRAQFDTNRGAFKSLADKVAEAIAGLSTNSKLSEDSFDRLNHLMNIQHSLQSTDEILGATQVEFATLRRSEVGSRFVSAAIEGLDTILLTLIEVAKDRSRAEAEFLAAMTSEEGNGISKVRTAFLAEESKLEPELRAKLLAASNHSERLIRLFGSLGQHFMALEAWEKDLSIGSRSGAFSS